MPATTPPAATQTPSPPSSLPSPSDLSAELRLRLPAWPQVAWRARTQSTQLDLLDRLSADPATPLPALLGAHEQLAGRGRAGRHYRNQAGQALMMSCAFETRLPTAALPVLSIWLGVATAEILREHVPQPSALTLKWPNDINWRGAKLAGMLLEATRNDHGWPVVVTGMGLNLHGGSTLSAELHRDITDWQQTGSATTPTQLAATLASAWQTAIAVAERRWQAGVGLVDLPDRFSACDALKGASVTLRDHDQALDEGRADGILPDGRMRLITARGERLVSVGDLSLRPAS